MRVGAQLVSTSPIFQSPTPHDAVHAEQVRVRAKAIEDEAQAMMAQAQRQIKAAEEAATNLIANERHAEQRIMERS